MSAAFRVFASTTALVALILPALLVGSAEARPARSIAIGAPAMQEFLHDLAEKGTPADPTRTSFGMDDPGSVTGWPFCTFGFYFEVDGDPEALVTRWDPSPLGQDPNAGGHCGSPGYSYLRASFDTRAAGVGRVFRACAFAPVWIGPASARTEPVGFGACGNQLFTALSGTGATYVGRTFDGHGWLAFETEGSLLIASD